MEMVFLLEDDLTPDTSARVLLKTASSVVCSSAIAVALEVTHVVVCNLMGLCMFFWVGQVFLESGADLDWVMCCLTDPPDLVPPPSAPSCILVYVAT